jgi:hypothetical protein
MQIGQSYISPATDVAECIPLPYSIPGYYNYLQADQWPKTRDRVAIAVPVYFTGIPYITSQCKPKLPGST